MTGERGASPKLGDSPRLSDSLAEPGRHAQPADGDTRPADGHAPPPGATERDIEAAGKVSEALEWIERARGRLYDLHQMIGRADFLLGDAAELLEAAGHDALAGLLREDIVGRNVVAGRWTFQLVEEFDDIYYEAVKAAERRVRDELMGGRRHVYEAMLKERRRSHGRPHHERQPDSEVRNNQGFPPSCR